MSSCIKASTSATAYIMIYITINLAHRKLVCATHAHLVPSLVTFTSDLLDLKIITPR